MTEDEINKESYRLVGLIKESKDEPTSKGKPKPSGSLGNLQVINLNSGKGPFYKHELNKDLSTSKIIVSIDGLDYGFNDSAYPEFSQLISAICDYPSFRDTVSKDYLESKSILWLSNVYRDKKASQDLINYLKSESENEVQSLTIYYPIINLHINKPFKIGDVEITFFSKEYFDQLWSRNTKEDRTEKEFNELYRKYQGRVFASYTIKAESKKANDVAFNKCLQAIDILKLFAPTVIMPERKCYIGIEESLHFNFQSDHITIPLNNKDAWKFSFSAKNDPFILTDKFLKDIGNVGLNQLSKFILTRPDNDISNLIIQAITLTSNAISNFDLHFRTAQLITIVESLLLEEDRKYDLEKKSKQRISKLFKDEKIIGGNDVSELLTRMYQVRHKIIHKAIRLPILMTDLRDFQMLVVELIKRLTVANRDISDKQSLIEILDKVS